MFTYYPVPAQPDHVKLGYVPRVESERLPASHINHHIAVSTKSLVLETCWAQPDHVKLGYVPRVEGERLLASYIIAVSTKSLV